MVDMRQRDSRQKKMKRDGTLSVKLKNFMRHLKVAQTIALLPANPYIEIEKNEVVFL